MTNLQDPQDSPAPQGPPGAEDAPGDPGPAAPPPGCPAHADPSYTGPALLYGERYLRNPAESYERMRRDHGQVAPVPLDPRGQPPQHRRCHTCGGLFPAPPLPEASISGSAAWSVGRPIGTRTEGARGCVDVRLRRVGAIGHDAARTIEGRSGHPAERLVSCA
ncbi:cytochrome P450 [Streptomyces hygroscopicus]|nr:cytochrome P450 [Streptomyces hygroscopicus]